MPSIFDIPLQETGGPEAQKGFDYQHRVAVTELLRMVQEPSRVLVEFDSHDDLLIKINTSNGILAEFVQIKNQSNWTQSDLYSDDKSNVPKSQKHSYSLISRQLNRAKGNDQASFRIVTSGDVNKDLFDLKNAFADRKPKSYAALKSLLLPKFNHLSFPQSRTAENWLDNMTWEVTGSEQAVNNKNLGLIHQAAFITTQRTLTPSQVEEIYQQLLNRVREASLKNTREAKACTRNELLEWINSYCEKLPIHTPPDTRKLIEILQAEARERCVGRWRAAGISAELAQELADDDLVGASATRWIDEQIESFLWIDAQFGAGKSLAVDRIYQQALQNYLDGTQCRIPVFLEAKALLRPLSEEIETLARKLGHPERDGVHVIIDGADERTLQSARNLVHEAADYSRAHPTSKLLITSSILTVTGYEAKRLPSLSKEEARSLFQRLAGPNNLARHIFEWRFPTDFGNPLFIILYCRFGPNYTRAELVNKMVKSALERVETDLLPAETLLIHLARWELDHGTGLIPEGVFDASFQTKSNILRTRLLEKRGEFFSFTLECVVQWFASLAITNGYVSVSEILDDTSRLERWQFAISIALSHANSDIAEKIMRPLAESQPAFASLVIDDGLPSWRPRDNEPRKACCDDVAHHLKNAMAAWKTGLEPLSSLPEIFPVDRQGALLDISAKLENGRFDATWTKVDEDKTYWGGLLPDHPAWAWRTTHEMIKSDLKKIATHEDCLSSASELLEHEAIWEQGCRLLGVSDYHCEKLSVAELTQQSKRRFFPPFEPQILNLFLSDPTRNKAEFIKSPHPQSDQIPQGNAMWEFFSLKRATERANSIYETSLIAYKEAVKNLFPKMVSRLPHYATYPFNLRGIVYEFNNFNQELRGYGLSYVIEPVAIGTIGHAMFIQGTETEAKDLFSKWSSSSPSMKDDRPSWQLRSCSDLILMFWQKRPATKIVSDWIQSDLNAVSW